MKFSSSYMAPMYHPAGMAVRVDRTKHLILHLRERMKFDAIAFRGTSGAAMAYPLSYLTGIPLLCVRKKDQHHSSCGVEGFHQQDISTYIIVDDFISTGETMKQILFGIREAERWGVANNLKYAKCVGIVLYNEPELRSAYDVETLSSDDEPFIEIPVWTIERD